MKSKALDRSGNELIVGDLVTAVVDPVHGLDLPMISFGVVVKLSEHLCTVNVPRVRPEGGAVLIHNIPCGLCLQIFSGSSVDQDNPAH